MATSCGIAVITTRAAMRRTDDATDDHGAYEQQIVVDGRESAWRPS